MRIYFIICSLSVFFYQLSYAIVDDDQFLNKFQNEIIPYVKMMPENYFLGIDAIKLHYRTSPYSNTSENCLVVLPGRGEPLERYAEFFYDLSDYPLRIFALDHRGQGQSDRFLPDFEIGYVDRFENYAKDLDLFLNNVVEPAHCKNTYLFAHSLGAGISLYYLMNHPNTIIKKVVLSSPMIKIQTKPVPFALAKPIAEAMEVIGNGAHYAVGQKKYSPGNIDEFTMNRFTTSKNRFLSANLVYDAFLKAKLGGPSYHWVREVLNGTADIRKKYSSFHLPTLLFRAGIELYSDEGEMEHFCKSIKDCQTIFFEKSKHEIINDRDESRTVAIRKMLDFFKE